MAKIVVQLSRDTYDYVERLLNNEIAELQEEMDVILKAKKRTEKSGSNTSMKKKRLKGYHS